MNHKILIVGKIVNFATILMIDLNLKLTHV